MIGRFGWVLTFGFFSIAAGALSKPVDGWMA